MRSPEKHFLLKLFVSQKLRNGEWPGLEGRNDLAQIVADETEANILRELLHDAAQGVLRIVRHRVRLVQYNQLIITSSQPSVNQTVPLYSTG